MRKKVLIITAVGLALLAAVVAVALNAVFTLTDVVVTYLPISETGEQESLELQQRLEEKFLGKSTAFLDLDEVKAVVAEYPAFEVTELKKGYPSSVIMTVAERREMFCIQKEGGYAVLDEEGRYLYDSAENLNRRSGENILLEGFEVSLKAGQIPSGNGFAAAILFANIFSEQPASARFDILSISLIGTENELAGAYTMQIQTREGVKIIIYEPDRLAEKKAAAALEKYLSLEGSERLIGFFDVVERIVDGAETGEITVSEHRTDIPKN